MKEGDVVRLKSGGPAMKISSVNMAANVSWRGDDGKEQYDTFNLHCLEPVEGAS